MPPKSKKASKKPHNSIHVKSGSDLLGLHDFLKKNKKAPIIVVIMMEGCPHCVTLERDIVDPLLNNSNRKNGIVRIQHTQLEHTPLKHLSKMVQGYPSVIKVENGSAEELTDSRDLKAMEKHAGVEPEEVAGESVATASAVANAKEMQEEAEEESPNLNTTAEEARGEITAEDLKSILAGKKKKHNVNVPQANNDVLNSQNQTAESMNVEFESPSSGKGAAVGGSLYASLLSAGKDLAPAAILTTAAIVSRLALGKRSKKSKRGGGKRSATRRTKKN